MTAAGSPDTGAVPLVVRMPATLRDAVKARAERDGVSMGEGIRRALTAYIKLPRPATRDEAARTVAAALEPFGFTPVVVDDPNEPVASILTLPPAAGDPDLYVDVFVRYDR